MCKNMYVICVTYKYMKKVCDLHMCDTYEHVLLYMPSCTREGQRTMFSVPVLTFHLSEGRPLLSSEHPG